MLQTLRNIKRLQYYVAAFMLMLLAGQSMAQIKSCGMHSNASGEHAAHMLDAYDPHAGHDMNHLSDMTDMTNQSQTSDCCMDDCQCAQNTCSTSLTVIFNQTGFKLLSDARTLLQNPDAAYISQASSALFRPPIIC